MNQSDTMTRAQSDRAENTLTGLGMLSLGVGVWYFTGWGGVFCYIGALFLLAAYRINLNKPPKET